MDTVSTVIWYWKSNKNPWSASEKAEWTSYTDVENQILEKAYETNLEIVDLGNYIVNLKKKVQISKANNFHQRSVKREVSSQIRFERFFLPPSINTVYNETSVDIDLPLVKKWWDSDPDSDNKYSINCNNQGEFEIANSFKHTRLNNVVQAVMKGIIQEGKSIGKQIEAEWIGQALMKTSMSKPKDVFKCIANIYTMETFLYHLINKTLIENDTSKASTLGPFCYMLSKFAKSACRNGSTICYKQTVWRGANLTPEMINAYKEALMPDSKAYCKRIKGPLISWNSFTSTTKNRKKAEEFGNVLFKIDMGGDNGAGYGCDISSLSNYEAEEEVLLPDMCQINLISMSEAEPKVMIHVKVRDLRDQ